MRGPHRARPQPPRRRRGHRELRDREGERRLRPVRRSAGPTSSRPSSAWATACPTGAPPRRWPRRRRPPNPPHRPPASRACPSAASVNATPSRRRRLPRDPAGPAAEPAPEPADLVDLRHRLVAALVLGLPVVAMAMIPAAAVRRVDVAQLRPRLARGAVVRLAVPPGGPGQPPPRRHHHGHAGVGRRAGRLRLVGLRPVLGPRRRAGHDPRFTLTASAGEAAGQIYLEVAAGVPVFILAGRYAEARAKRRAGAAHRGARSTSAPRT